MAAPRPAPSKPRRKTSVTGPGDRTITKTKRAKPAATPRPGPVAKPIGPKRPGPPIRHL